MFVEASKGQSTGHQSISTVMSMDTCYSEVLCKVRVEVEEQIWSLKKLNRLDDKKRINPLSVNTFREHCDPGLYS